MTLRARAVAVACLVGVTLLVTPAVADAQGRRSVRAVRPRTAVVVGAYRPFYYDPWYSSPYGLWYPAGYGYARAYDVSASLRLQVTPRETEVFIDGYFAGTVDEFDGFFQRLHLEPGDHNLELYLPGHRKAERKVYLQPGTGFRVRHAMESLSPGEAEPARPVAAAAPPAGSTPRPIPGRPRARPSNVESSFGELALRVQPADATVTIDGERWEGAPDDRRLVVQLGTGAHRIEIQKDGYRTYSTDVYIRSGETETLNVALARQE